MLAALVLLLHLEPVRLRPIGSDALVRTLEQPRFEPGRIQVFGQRPTQASLPRAFQVVVHAGAADAEACTDLVLTEALRRQAQNLVDVAHGYSPLGHRASPC